MSLFPFSDPSKCQGVVPSPGSQQLPALGRALLLVPQLSCCLSGLVLPQDLALSPCRPYLYLHQVMLLILQTSGNAGWQVSVLSLLCYTE